MGTTTNNGWTYPESTDLVKDGATAIQTLADDIDTTLGVYADSGLVLLNTTSFSAVASQSINDVFSATYTNYQVLIEYRPSANAGMDLRFRVSGTDNSTSNYSNALYNYTSSGGGGAQTGDNAVSYARVDAGFTGTDGVTSLTIFNPFASQKTSIITRTEGFNTSNPILSTTFGGNVFDATTSFTGFSLIRSSGTMTGSVSVYGYNK
jgi:hypothetical protein